MEKKEFIHLLRQHQVHPKILCYLFYLVPTNLKVHQTSAYFKHPYLNFNISKFQNLIKITTYQISNKKKNFWCLILHKTFMHTFIILKVQQFKIKQNKKERKSRNFSQNQQASILSKDYVVVFNKIQKLELQNSIIEKQQQQNKIECSNKILIIFYCYNQVATKLKSCQLLHMLSRQMILYSFLQLLLFTSHAFFNNSEINKIFYQKCQGEKIAINHKRNITQQFTKIINKIQQCYQKYKFNQFLHSSNSQNKFLEKNVVLSFISGEKFEAQEM
eukprot:TRINITY_DN33942_c0_g1_i6.p1 TRINITY_DN33942_c0_g1~~TRINITY_DN33942_c0_g1_i6.p1  ORF type:complete len:289 (-),score=-12.33 TRINITY_DN33942_c0_g1_i6:216-1037(-)